LEPISTPRRGEELITVVSSAPYDCNQSPISARAILEAIAAEQRTFGGIQGPGGRADTTIRRCSVFLERWLRRKNREQERSEVDEASRTDRSTPSARQTALTDLDPQRPAAAGAAATAQTSRQKSASGPPVRTRWFDEADIVALKGLTDDKQIAQVIARKPVGASREEVLFRYYLSRAVFVGEFDLPVLPRTATEIIELSRRPRAEISDYARVVESDPSVVKAVIDVANSSFFSSLSEVSGLDQAIVRIGLRQLERIVLMHAMRSRVFRVRGYEQILQHLVAHSLAAGIGAQTAAATSAAPSGDAFLGGLFHDLGKFVLVRIVGDVQKKLHWTAPPQLLQDAFDTFHVQIGESICRHWQFPPMICDAVGAHECPGEAAQGTELHRAVYVGNRLAHVVIDGSDLSQELPTDDPVVATEGLDREALELLTGTVIHEVKAFEGLGVAPRAS
jgi:HD-like signal output (HDOD) protein